MNYIIHRSEERGKANYGWLDTKYSFSFARYYDPDKMGFGLLRVLNDDIVLPDSGFGTHPHDNMEIITIILDGQLQHKDSMGNGSVIKKDEVQVMSAGTGITHSEFNPSKTEKVSLLQIWIYPKEENIKPRYDQKAFPREERKNKLTTVASGYNENGSLYIHQNAEIKLGYFDKGNRINYKIREGNGVYLFVIDGHIKTEEEELFRRDAIGIYDTEEFEIDVLENSEFILLEVPMN
ncbi:MAG: pirin family protein [Ignavibacterium sp.]|uniref:Pirin family protein n=1 Tax=Ignavibacterium album TaxID=591197 RepID=A0A7V2ZMF1_9BACT|nr:pirin family protein [Ignavibacterium sp.]